MAGLTALGVGEVLWDVLPDGRTLGGAPANFAYHVNALGSVGIPVSRVGNDALGRETLAALSERGLCVEHVSLDPDHPTGTVLAELDEDGVAAYTFPDDVAWDFLAPDPAALELAARADIICFGTLAQRSPVSRKGVRGLLRGAPDALKIYDINLRQDFYDAGIIRASLGLADVVKLNDGELAVLTEMFCLPEDERAGLDVLVRRYDLKLAALTRGAEGSLLVAGSGFSDLAGSPVEIVDTIGAGDAFTAAMALAFLDGASLEEVNRYAAKVAGAVCGQQGGMPEPAPSLRR